MTGAAGATGADSTTGRGTERALNLGEDSLWEDMGAEMGVAASKSSPPFCRGAQAMGVVVGWERVALAGGRTGVVKG